ncbi:hypothetical protein DFH28DRAFT_1132128 [Melampsora americana]|nr:hypothetical protein DFH28DRAFT_1132128 [Melampsora americana]
MALPLASRPHHDSRPRKVVSTNGNNNFTIKRNSAGSTQLNPHTTHSFSSSAIPTTSRLSASINGHPIKAKIKLPSAIARTSPSLSPHPASGPFISRPSPSSHKANSTSSVITARVVKTSNALHQISSRPNSPFRPLPHTKDIVLSPHVTQRPSPSRSRTNTHSNRCPSQLDSDCFSSDSSTSANADGGSELSRTHPLGLSTRSRSVQNAHFTPSNVDSNHSTYTPHASDHHQQLKILVEKDSKPPKDEAQRSSLTHKTTNSISNVTSSEDSHSLASPVNLINRRAMGEIPRIRNVPSDSTCTSSSSQRPTSIESNSNSNSKTGFNETWTKPTHHPSDAGPSSSHNSASVDQKPVAEEDWELLNDKDAIGEEEDGEHQETEKITQVGEVKEDEARVNRKILDLEISNSSLLAINARLERTKLKQASEIRELRKKMRDRSIGPISSHSLYPTDDGQSIQSGPEDSESEPISQESLKIENLMKEDEKFSEAIRVIESLMNRAKAALVYQAGEKDLQNKKVLNRVEIGGVGGEEEEEEEEEEEVNEEVEIGELCRSSLSHDSKRSELIQLTSSGISDRTLLPSVQLTNQSKLDPIHTNFKPSPPSPNKTNLINHPPSRQPRPPSPLKSHSILQTPSDPKLFSTRMTPKSNLKSFH